MSDLVDRQLAIDALRALEKPAPTAQHLSAIFDCEDVITSLPSTQPEPAIPLQWIEAQIEWLKSLDNAFLALTAGQLSVMVNKWKEEQDE